MSKRGDELRAQAEAIEAEDALAEAKDAALAAYNKDQTEANYAAYRAAVQALADARQLARAGRSGMAVIVDASSLGEGE